MQRSKREFRKFPKTQSGQFWREGELPSFAGDSKFHAPEFFLYSAENSMKYFFTLVVFFFTQISAAQKVEAPADIPEAGTTEAIVRATTETRFLSPWVASIPASSQVPSPEKFFGRIMGAPGELVNSENSEAYLHA